MQKLQKKCYIFFRFNSGYGGLSCGWPCFLSLFSLFLYTAGFVCRVDVPGPTTMQELALLCHVIFSL